MLLDLILALMGLMFAILSVLVFCVALGIAFLLPFFGLSVIGAAIQGAIKAFARGLKKEDKNEGGSKEPNEA